MKTPDTFEWREIERAGGEVRLTAICADTGCSRFLGAVVHVQGTDVVYTQVAFDVNSDREGNSHHLLRDAPLIGQIRRLTPGSVAIFQCARHGDAHERDDVLLREVDKGTKKLPIPPNDKRRA